MSPEVVGQFKWGHRDIPLIYLSDQQTDRAGGLTRFRFVQFGRADLLAGGVSATPYIFRDEAERDEATRLCAEAVAHYYFAGARRGRDRRGSAEGWQAHRVAVEALDGRTWQLQDFGYDLDDEWSRAT